MINMIDIHNKINSENHITLTDVLGELLADVESVGFNTEKGIVFDDKAIEAARDELTEGGFGDEETEETMELDTDFLESFFSSETKKNYQMLANTDILKTDGTEY